MKKVISFLFIVFVMVVLPGQANTEWAKQSLLTATGLSCGILYGLNRLIQKVNTI